jgi:hypothetical protein
MLHDEKNENFKTATIGSKTDKLRHRLLEKCYAMLNNTSLELQQMKFCREVIKDLEDYAPSTPEHLNETKTMPFTKVSRG